MTDKFIFIGGVGRSGTSITREILATHNQVITFPFEYRFIIDPDGIIDFIKSSSNSWSPYYTDKRLRRLESFLCKLGKTNGFMNMLGDIVRSNQFLKSKVTSNAYHGWNLQEYFPNYYQSIATLIGNLEDFRFKGAWAGSDSFKVDHCISYSSPQSEVELYSIFKSFLNDLFSKLFEHQHKNILVEDNTWNLLFASELSKLFTGAKFVHVYRDPRDVVSSFCKQRWMPSDKVQAAVICRDLYVRILDNLNSLESGSVLQFSIEELIQNKASVLHRLSEFSGLSLADSMLDFPLSSSSVNRWKKDFSKVDIIELAPYLREITEQLGYEW
jgi:hypothetical protein